MYCISPLILQFISIFLYAPYISEAIFCCDRIMDCQRLEIIKSQEVSHFCFALHRTPTIDKRKNAHSQPKFAKSGLELETTDELVNSVILLCLMQHCYHMMVPFKSNMLDKQS